MDEEELDADDREARRRGLRFYVATEPAPRRRWDVRTEPGAGLGSAMERARALAGLRHEVGVFVEVSGSGYVCWTSRVPDLLNSTVIWREVS